MINIDIVQGIYELSLSPNVYKENQASRTNPGHQGQIYIFGGQGSQGVYHII